MNDGLLFVASILAVYRLARLVAIDTITEPLRNRLASSTSSARKWLWDLATCPYCLGPWFAAALTVVLAAGPGVPLPLLWWPAISGGASLAVVADLRMTRRG